MIKKALTGIYAFILGFVAWDRCLIVISQLSDSSTPLVPDLVAALLSVAFFTGFAAYLVTRNIVLLGISLGIYSIYAVSSVIKTYRQPLISEQEYILAIAVYLALGLPLFVALTVNFKHNKAIKSLR